MANTISHDHVRNVAEVQISESGVTPAAVQVDVGFQPRFVKAENISERVGLEWHENMAAAAALKSVAAGTRTQITTLGITVGSTGFTVGLDTDLLPTHTGNNVIQCLVIG